MPGSASLQTGALPLPRAGQATAPSSTPELLRGPSQTVIARFSPELASLMHQTLRQTCQGRAKSLAGCIFRVSPPAQGGFRARIGRPASGRTQPREQRPRGLVARVSRVHLCHQDASEPRGCVVPFKGAAGTMLSQHQALIYGSVSPHTHALWALWLSAPFPTK